MLGLWEYFWKEADWDTAPPPAPAPAPAPESRGGGHTPLYTGPDPDFWLVRERYLRRYVEPLTKAITDAPVITNDNETNAHSSRTVVGSAPGGALLQQALAAAIARAQTAADGATLRDATQRARALALDISETRQQYYNRAIALLLLDAF